MRILTNTVTAQKYPLGDEVGLGIKILTVFPVILMLICVCMVKYGASNILGIAISGMNGMAFYGVAVVAFNVAAAIGSPLAGSLGDIFGRKRVSLFALASFTLAMVLCGLIDDIKLFILAYFLLGFSYAHCQSIVATMIADAVEGRTKYQLLGIRHSCAQTAIMLGPIVCGAISDAIGARAAFLVLSPIGMLCFLAIYFITPDIRYHKGEKSVDWTGILYLFLSLGLFMFLMSMIGSQIPWLSLRSLATLVIVIAASILFIRNEKRAKNPIIDPSLFRYRGFSVSLINQGLLNCAGVLNSNYLVLYAQAVLGFAAVQTGLFSLARLTCIIASMFVGRWLGKYKLYKLSFFLSTAFAFTTGFMLLFVDRMPYTLYIILSISFSYLATSFETVPCSLIPTVILPPEKRGVGLGAVWFSENVSYTLSAAVYALVMNLMGNRIETGFRCLVFVYIGFLSIRLINLCLNHKYLNFSENHF